MENFAPYPQRLLATLITSPQHITTTTRQDVCRNVRWNIAAEPPIVDQAVCPHFAACRHASQANDETAASVRRCSADALPTLSRCRQIRRNSPAESLR